MEHRAQVAGEPADELVESVFVDGLEVARSRARLAAVLRAVGRTSDASEQTELARQTARQLGAKPLLTELRTLGGASRRAGSSRREEALTAREQEVLALVVSNILAKLGAAGRTEAVALARRGGLFKNGSR